MTPDIPTLMKWNATREEIIRALCACRLGDRLSGVRDLVEVLDEISHASLNGRKADA